MRSTKVIADEDSLSAKIKGRTMKRLIQTRGLLLIQTGKEYSISDTIDFLLDNVPQAKITMQRTS